MHSHPLEQRSHDHEIEQHHHSHADPHRRASSLSDIILGGQDGLVNVLGVIRSCCATYDVQIVLVAGLAATFAESVSMGGRLYFDVGRCRFL
jgi:hypothetical protein